MTWVAIALAASTLVSEDAAALGAGALARAGGVSVAVATVAVAVGIWIGDVGLFVAGRAARRWGPAGRWIGMRWPNGELNALAERLEAGAPAAIVVSRMLPGTRAALYVAAGLFRVRAPLFITCSGVAAFAWTAAIVTGLSWVP